MSVRALKHWLCLISSGFILICLCLFIPPYKKRILEHLPGESCGVFEPCNADLAEFARLTFDLSYSGNRVSLFLQNERCSCPGNGNGSSRAFVRALMYWIYLWSRLTKGLKVGLRVTGGILTSVPQRLLDRGLPVRSLREWKPQGQTGSSEHHWCYLKRTEGHEPPPPHPKAVKTPWFSHGGEEDDAICFSGLSIRELSSVSFQPGIRPSDSRWTQALDKDMQSISKKQSY